MPGHELTVAELRATLAAELDHAAGLQAAMARAVITMLDDYIEAAQPAMSAEDRARARLTKAAAARRAWKEYETELPELITAAAAAGMTAPHIARELGATESYVYRILRTTPARLDHQ
ncbi:hypothetical protein [Streptomyces sp. NBC_01718]|uniref:hypothetical protein n=1 Tax=Streptomyces sp. NBC_01718 TaxID=2975919 RepID=UPI00352DDFDB